MFLKSQMKPKNLEVSAKKKKGDNRKTPYGLDRTVNPGAMTRQHYSAHLTYFQVWVIKSERKKKQGSNCSKCQER